MFGAHAVALHGFPRATADLDVTIELGTLSPEAFVRALARRGFAPRFADAGFIRATRVIPVVHRGSAMPIDIVLAGPGLEQVFLASVVRHRLGRQVIPVISREHLIVTKMLAARPKDLEDVRELIAVAGDAVDWAHVDELLVELEQALGQSDLRERLAQLRQR